MKSMTKKIVWLLPVLCLLLCGVTAMAYDIDTYPVTTYIDNGDGTATLTCYIDHPHYETVIDEEFMGFPVTYVGYQSLHRVVDPDNTLGASRPVVAQIPETVTVLGSRIVGDDTTHAQLTFTGDAPSFEKDTFLDKTVTVYFPAGNASWEAVAGYQYGGYVTWTPVCETHNTSEGVCTLCGDGCTHTLDQVVVLEEATCSRWGSSYTRCTNCAYVRYNIINATAHTFDEGVVIQEPTCKEGGILRTTCTVCGHVGYRDILKTNDHTYGKGEWTVERTCTTNGKRLYTCTVCGYQKTVTFPALGHNYVDKICTNCGLEDSVFLHELLDDKTCKITRYTGTDTDVVFPEKLAGRTVTVIGTYVLDTSYNYNQTVTSVTIPATVEKIEDKAFKDCKELTTIRFNGCGMTCGDDILRYCNKLTKCYITDLEGWCSNEGLGEMFDYEYTLYLNDVPLTELVVPETVTCLRSFAFAKCRSIRTVAIHDNVTDMGESTFYGCSNLREAKLSDQLPKIPKSCFLSCKSLQRVTWPSKMTEIESNAFGYCNALEEVLIPETVTTIGTGVFQSCTSLRVIRVPASVTSMGNSVFNGCKNVTDIYFCGTKPSIGYSVFPGIYGNGWYPAGDQAWINVVEGYTGSVKWKPWDVKCIHRFRNNVCTLCGESFTAHSYATGVWINTPTCTKAGKRSYCCTSCDHIKYVTFPATGHSYEENVCTTCGVEASAAPVITLQYPTLSFEDEILLNVYFDISNLDNTEEIGLLMSATDSEQWNVDTVDKVLPGYVYDEEAKLFRVRSDGIAAKNMGDTVYIGLYAKLNDGTYVYSGHTAYSPKSYALSLLNTGSTGMKQLVVAMLNYGAAAQQYFSHNTDNPANASLKADQLALVDDYTSSMMSAVKEPTADKQGAFVHTGNIALRYRTVSFEGAFSVNYYCNFATAPVGAVTMYYWTGADYEAARTLSVNNATAAIPMTDVGGGQYMGTVRGIAAKNLDRGFYVAFGYSDGTTQYFTDLQTYSIGTYCNSTVSKNISASPLAAATAVYGYYAKQMFG